jgi:hypothetical protein
MNADDIPALNEKYPLPEGYRWRFGFGTLLGIQVQAPKEWWVWYWAPGAVVRCDPPLATRTLHCAIDMSPADSYEEAAAIMYNYCLMGYYGDQNT